MAAPTVVAAQTAGCGAASSLNPQPITLPTVQTGDFLVLVDDQVGQQAISSITSTGPSQPVAWSGNPFANGTIMNLSAWSCPLVAGDSGATINITYAAGQRSQVTLIVVRGSACRIDAIATAQRTASTTNTAIAGPTITPLAHDSLLVAFVLARSFAINVTVVITPDAAYIEPANGDGSTTSTTLVNNGCEVQTKALSGQAGTSQTALAATSGVATAQNSVIVFAIPPVDAPIKTPPRRRTVAPSVPRGRMDGQFSTDLAVPAGAIRSPRDQRVGLRVPRGRIAQVFTQTVVTPATYPPSRPVTRRPVPALVRRGQAWETVRPQLNPPLTPQAQRRVRGLVALRRGRTPTPVPAQLNPPIVLARPSRRRPFGWIARRRITLPPPAAHSHVPAGPPRRRLLVPSLLVRSRLRPVVPSTVAATAPSLAPRLSAPRRLAGVLLRRGRSIAPIPPQVTVPNPAFVAKPSSPRRRFNVPRRGRFITPVRDQVTFAPVPLLPRLSVPRRAFNRIIRGHVANVPLGRPIPPAPVTNTSPRRVPQRRWRGRSWQPIQTQQSPPITPQRPVTRRPPINRRHRGSELTVVQAQLNPPITPQRPTTRRPAAFLVRRARTRPFLQAQQNPLLVGRLVVVRRAVPALIRRGRSAVPWPQVFQGPAWVARATSPRRAVQLLVRRGRRPVVMPNLQTPPPYVSQMPRPRRQLAAILRRRPTVSPPVHSHAHPVPARPRPRLVPALRRNRPVIAPVPAPLTGHHVVPSRPRRRLLALPARRVSKPGPPLPSHAHPPIRLARLAKYLPSTRRGRGAMVPPGRPIPPPPPKVSTRRRFVAFLRRAARGAGFPWPQSIDLRTNAGTRWRFTEVDSTWSAAETRTGWAFTEAGRTWTAAETSTGWRFTEVDSTWSDTEI